MRPLNSRLRQETQTELFAHASRCRKHPTERVEVHRRTLDYSRTTVRSQRRMNRRRPVKWPREPYRTSIATCMSPTGKPRTLNHQVTPYRSNEQTKSTTWSQRNPACRRFLCRMRSLWTRTNKAATHTTAMSDKKRRITSSLMSRNPPSRPRYQRASTTLHAIVCSSLEVRNAPGSSTCRKANATND